MLTTRRWTSLALTALTLATSAHAAVSPAPATGAANSTPAAQAAKTATATATKAKTSTQSASTNASVASASQTSSGIFSNIGLSYLGIFSGPSLAKVNSLYQDEEKTSPIGLTNRFTVSKKLMNDISLAAIVQATTQIAAVSSSSSGIGLRARSARMSSGPRIARAASAIPNGVGPASHHDIAISAPGGNTRSIAIPLSMTAVVVTTVRHRHRGASPKWRDSLST